MNVNVILFGQCLDHIPSDISCIVYISYVLCSEKHWFTPYDCIFLFFSEMLDNTFLLDFANHNSSSTEQFQLGVSLKLKSSTVREIIRVSDDAVSNTFAILESWLDSRTNDGTSATLFDDLSAACVYIKRADLVEFVRCGEWAIGTVVAYCEHLMWRQ